MVEDSGALKYGKYEKIGLQSLHTMLNAKVFVMQNRQMATLLAIWMTHWPNTTD